MRSDIRDSLYALRNFKCCIDLVHRVSLVRIKQGLVIDIFIGRCIIHQHFLHYIRVFFRIPVCDPMSLCYSLRTCSILQIHFIIFFAPEVCIPYHCASHSVGIMKHSHTVIAQIKDIIIVQIDCHMCDRLCIWCINEIDRQSIYFQCFGSIDPGIWLDIGICPLQDRGGKSLFQCVFLI